MILKDAIWQHVKLGNRPDGVFFSIHIPPDLDVGFGKLPNDEVAEFPGRECL